MITAVILICIICASFAFSVKNAGSENLTCIIKVNGELYKEIKLRENYNNFIEINSQFGYNKIYIDGNTVKMHNSDCEDKLCIDNEISKPHQSVVCLPSRVIVYIEGDTDLDYVSY